MKRPILLLVLLASCFAALAARPRAAHADDDTQRARKHFERGEKLFALGRFDDALAAYEAAFEAKALPDFLFNIGQCYRNLGDYESAIFSYRKYLKLKPNARNRDAVEQLIAQLEAELEDADRADRDRKLDLAPRKPPADDGISPWWYVGGGVAAVAVTITAVVLLSGDDGPTLPDSDLGNLDFAR